MIRAAVTRWFRPGATVVLGLALLVSISLLVVEVSNRLTALERANSDNSQWVLMQAEVEVLRLQAAIIAARDTPDPARIEEVRRWFNVFYSRVKLIEESPIYATLLAGPDYAPHLARMRGYLDRTVPLIDSPDTTLAAGLDDVARDLPDVRASARSITLDALSDFAAQSDLNRESIARTLIRLALVTGTLVLSLSVAALVLFAQFGRSQAQAEALRQTGARLSTIVSTSADGIVVTDVDGTIRDINPAAEAIFGHRAADIQGRDALDLLFAGGRAAAQQTAFLQALRRPAPTPAPISTPTSTPMAPPLRIEVDARRADGSVFPAEVSISRGDWTDRDSLVVAFVRDISDRRAAERDLTRALDRALAGERAKADFLAVMSHEMRTPLNGLIGSMDLMRRTGLSAEQTELMGVMENSGDILLGHVNAVLDLSRAEAGAIRPEAADFDLDRLIGDVVANQSGLAAAAGNTMTTLSLSGAMGTVRGDRGRVGQILLNLVGNAVKFTRNGRITVETERLPASPAAPHLVEIRVADTGIGIAEEDLDRIFDDFVTLDPSYGRSAGGTGLGLGIARRLARAMGGEIGAESEPGEGSLFWLRLPLPPASTDTPAAAATTPTPATSTTRDDAPAGPPRSVLLVEDNATNRFLLRRFLEAGGHRVTEASDGIDGIAAAGREAFDLILMDISMPRMDGLAATRAIRAGGGPSARARILALTAHALPEEQARFRAAGMEATLTKPIGQTALLRAVAGQSPRGADPSDKEPLVDPAIIGDLHRFIGTATARALILRMMDEAEQMVATLSRLNPEQDRDEIQRLCHQLAGSSGTFGVVRLRALLIAAEAALKADDPATVRLSLAPLAEVWPATRAALAAASDAFA